jgi:hypothetical protein
VSFKQQGSIFIHSFIHSVISQVLLNIDLVPARHPVVKNTYNLGQEGPASPGTEAVSGHVSLAKSDPG